MKTPIKINSIKHYFLDPEYLKPYLLMFSEYLADKGFTALTIRTYFDSVARLSKYDHFQPIYRLYFWLF